MTETYRRFLPENTHPSQFMRPVTRRFAPHLQELSVQAAQTINDHAVVLFDRVAKERRTEKPPIPTLRQQKPGLRLGTELELLFFSENSQPDQDKKLDDTRNPNYDANHLQKVADIARTITDPRHGLADILDPHVDLGKIFMEIRTVPGTVDNYHTAMQRIAEWVRNASSALGIHPVVISQHFHFSLVDPARRINLMERREHRKPVRTGLVDAYHRALPFVRLPEDLAQTENEYMIGGKDGVKTKGKKRSIADPFRLEGRVNNSEYAFDPNLNLFVNLAGLRRGLVHVDNILGIDEDYPLPLKSIGGFDDARLFVIGRKTMSYEKALDRIMDDDFVLTRTFGSNLLVGLANAHYLYPSISAGETTLASARSEFETELDAPIEPDPIDCYTREVA